MSKRKIPKKNKTTTFIDNQNLLTITDRFHNSLMKSNDNYFTNKSFE